MNNYQKVREHLEFLGYTLEVKNLPPDSKSHRGKHFLAKASGHKTSFFITHKENAGFSFVATYKTKPITQQYKAEFLEILNKMSLECYLTSFVSSEDLNTVFLLSWYPDIYSKTSFGSFLDKLENDVKFSVSNNKKILNFID